MKATEEGRYVHVLCAVWTPGVTFGDEVRLEPVEGVAKVRRGKRAGVGENVHNPQHCGTVEGVARGRVRE